MDTQTHAKVTSQAKPASNAAAPSPTRIASPPRAAVPSAAGLPARPAVSVAAGSPARPTAPAASAPPTRPTAPVSGVQPGAATPRPGVPPARPASPGISVSEARAKFQAGVVSQGRTASQATVNLAASSAMTDEEIFDLIARAKTDPVAAKQACDMQRRLYDEFEKMIQGAIEIITADEIKAEPTSQKNVSVVELSNAARQRASQAKQKRELAQNMMIGALINRDNPGWDPLDPSTSKRSGKNGLLALMEMDLRAELEAELAAQAQQDAN